MSPPRLYHLALRELHAAAGATLGVAEGWSLPFRYGDPADELEALRTSAAVFNRSHRSRFLVHGVDAVDVLGRVFAGHLADLDEGRSMRTVALNEAGHVIDLVLVSRTGGIAYLVSGEAPQRTSTFERLFAAIDEDFDARVEDRTDSTCLIALAGPEAAALAAAHFSEALQSRLRPLHNSVFEFHGFRTFVSQSSDVGEDGFEFMVAPAVAQHMIETLGEANVRFAGFEAIQTARVEACVPAYHPDLDGLSPAEADLDVLLGIPGGVEDRILAALLIESEDTLPAGTSIQHTNGSDAGEMRSCVYSPTLRSTVGLAVLKAAEAFPGAEFRVAGSRAFVSAKPLYRRR